MAVTTKVLVPAQTAIVYPSPIIVYRAKNVTTIVDKFTARNYGAVSADLTVWIVSNLTIDFVYPNQTIIITKTLAPGEVYTFPEIVGQVLIHDDGLCMLASVDDTIAVRASGREIN